MTFRLSTITIKTENDFSKNLDKIIKQIKLIENGYILTPELCLTGYSYDNLDEAAIFSKIAIKTLQELAINKIISITLTIKKDNKFYNNLHIFHKQKLIYTQPKVKLFTPNNEDKYFYAGKESDIKIIDIDGVKIATLICFELRFIKLWQQIQGADIILIPAMWGEKRKEHLLALSRSLAIANQCFVLVTNSVDMKNGSSIITPFGKVLKNDKKYTLSSIFDFKEIKKMRRYMNIGL